MSQSVAKSVRFYSPEFSGAHRCTILRLVRAPFGESCRRRCQHRALAKGELTLPLRHKERVYPSVQPQNSINSGKRVNPDLRFLRVLSRKVVIACQSF